MDKAEFDRFAEEYRSLHAVSISASGEAPEYFAQYKVLDVARTLATTRIAPRRLLDFGAGIGGSVPYFRRHLPYTSVTCLDVSEKSLELGRSRFPDDAEFRLFDGTTIPFEDDTFDVAFAACVFHHIDAQEHDSLLRELRRVVRKGGLFFLFEHNPLNPLTVHAVSNCPFDENAQLIRAKVMQGRLRHAGFTTVKCHYRIFFPRFLRMLRPIEPLLTWCPLGAQYALVATK